jgi:hypothetical protein
VYLRLHGRSVASPALERGTPATIEWEDISFVEAATRVLSQSEGPLRASDICERAAKLGFKGGRTGNVTPEAFRRRMAESKLFEGKDGRFSLKRPAAKS